MPGFSCNRDQLDLWRIDWVARGDWLSQGGQYVQCTWQCDNWNTASTWNDSFVLLFSLSYYFKVTWSESMCHIRAPEHTPTHSLGASIMLTCLSSDSGTQTTPPQHSRAKDYWYISDIWDHLTQYPDRKDYRLIAILLVSVIAHLKTE